MKELIKAAGRGLRHKAGEWCTIAANMPLIGLALAPSVYDIVRHPKEGNETLKRIASI